MNAETSVFTTGDTLCCQNKKGISEDMPEQFILDSLAVLTRRTTP